MAIIQKFKDMFSPKREKRTYSIDKYRGMDNVVSYLYSGSYEKDKGILHNLYSRIANDIGLIEFQLIDEDNTYVPLDEYNKLKQLFIRPNIDQVFGEFIRDLVYICLERGAAAIVPIEYSDEYFNEISDFRVGTIDTWKARSVVTSVWNDQIGTRKTVELYKKEAPIILSPLSYLFNDEMSALRRLTSKLNSLESIDNKINSGKLDLIIQLPFSYSGELREERAKQRIKNIENQIHNSSHGIAYIGGEEKITQLNRPANNTIAEEIQNLIEMVFNQIGVSKNIIQGTETEAEREIYYRRMIYPLLNNICDEVTTKYLLEDGLTMSYRRTDYKKWIPVNEVIGLISIGVIDALEVRDMYGLDMSLISEQDDEELEDDDYEEEEDYEDDE